LDPKRFIGRYEHALDTKGRVILPARFRGAFDGDAYLSEYRTRCLALWTPDAFEQKLAEIEAMQDGTVEQLNQARYMASGSAPVEIDKQGRLAIPQFMREYARLDNEVLVVGAISRIELWSPAVWNEKVQPAERAFADEA